MTDADLLQALRDCYDPLLKRNIVDLGRVRSATLTPDLEAPGTNIPGAPLRYIAHVHVFVPALDDDSNALLCAQIENRLAGLPAISRTEIRLSQTPFPILQ